MTAISTRNLYFNWKETLLYIKIRKSRKEGGIVIFIRDSLLYILRNDLSINCEDIESLYIKTLNSKTRSILFTYKGHLIGI